MKHGFSSRMEVGLHMKVTLICLDLELCTNREGEIKYGCGGDVLQSAVDVYGCQLSELRKGNLSCYGYSFPGQCWWRMVDFCV